MPTTMTEPEAQDSKAQVEADRIASQLRQMAD